MLTKVNGIIATLLLICFGMMLPAAAMPVRVCLLEEKDRVPDCCSTCHTERRDCCADLDQMPDATVPGGLFVPPAFSGFQLPFFEPVRTTEIAADDFPSHRHPPIRGPDSPAAFRSVLGVWRL